jgi:hypothetical protein
VVVELLKLDLLELIQILIQVLEVRVLLLFNQVLQVQVKGRQVLFLEQNIFLEAVLEVVLVVQQILEVLVVELQQLMARVVMEQQAQAVVEVEEIMILLEVLVVQV